MKYAKPEIAVLASASRAIQGSQKQSATVTDDEGQMHKLTIPAYESDE